MSTIKTRAKLKKGKMHPLIFFIGILFRKLLWPTVKTIWSSDWEKRLKIQGKSFWPIVRKNYSIDREKLLKNGGKRSKFFKMLEIRRTIFEVEYSLELVLEVANWDVETYRNKLQNLIFSCSGRISNCDQIQ